ncbi:MAG: response regulator transcription factor [Thermoanaerobacterales bacterium]|nr:response regulator transcription factor [Thermoanaerobacterales bacterium]
MAMILVVDDEKHILELVRYALEREGHRVLTAGDGVTALHLAQERLPDLVILDVMLPEQDGLAICRRLRNGPSTGRIPIIMLSARGQETDRVLGLETGADDYITKPFSVRELAARVKAHLRRKAAEPEKDVLTCDGLTIDPRQYTIACGGRNVSLTPKEFELLWYLAQHRGRVLTREELLESVWGYEYGGDSRTVDVHVRHIRQKLSGLPLGDGLIETVRGVGYRVREG